MDRESDRVLAECRMMHLADMNMLAQYLADFFDDADRHQGRMMKRCKCYVARKAFRKILEMYNGLATRYNELARKARSYPVFYVRKDMISDADMIKIQAAVRDAVDRLGNVYFRYNDGSDNVIKDLHGTDFSIDKYGTYTVEIRCGRNGAMPRRPSYYFTQLAYLLDTLECAGVRAWPIKLDFDVPDDVFSVTLGLEPL